MLYLDAVLGMGRVLPGYLNLEYQHRNTKEERVFLAYNVTIKLIRTSRSKKTHTLNFCIWVIYGGNRTTVRVSNLLGTIRGTIAVSMSTHSLQGTHFFSGRQVVRFLVFATTFILVRLRAFFIFKSIDVL